ncbi:MAG: hypothetical protein H6739_15430 [Alphaproteobacteria bacterium]|nr:hypothetical protein [Alphaproteobacteria bacterium]
MRAWIPTLLLLAMGCSPETSFQNNTGDNSEVEGGGALEYSPAELIFEDLTVGNTYSQDITFSSVGEVNLTVYEVRVISSAEGTFYVGETEDLVIAPGTALPVTITASLAQDEPREGTLRVRTNDVEYIEFTIPMIARPEGYTGDDTGDTAAE